MSLAKSGPRTVRELELVEYRLEVVNEGASPVEFAGVLDRLPDEIGFTEAVPTPAGTYDPNSGIWQLPRLGTGDDDRTAGLLLRGVVRSGLLSEPVDVLTVVNRAEIVTPDLPEPVATEVVTNVVCSSCVDWEIVSADLDGDDHLELGADWFEVRFFLDVLIANNGPVPSEGVLTVLDFDVAGGSLDPSLMLEPASPVAVFLAPGDEAVISFATDWTKGPDDDYAVSVTLELRDATLLDPVEPNTVSVVWTGEVEYPGSGGGCFIATAAYGSHLDLHVGSLRRFRDETLMRSRLGRALVSWYYEVSPPIAYRIEQSESLRAITRAALVPVVFAVENPGLALVVSLIGLFGVLAYGAGRKHRRAAEHRDPTLPASGNWPGPGCLGPVPSRRDNRRPRDRISLRLARKILNIG